MQRTKVMVTLSGIIAAACLILAFYIVKLNRELNRLPDSAVNDLLTVLEEAQIEVDPDLIQTERERGTVYLYNSANYNHAVAEMLGGGKVEVSYEIPEGELILTEGGARVEFGENFSFRYDRDTATYERELERTEIAENPQDLLGRVTGTKVNEVTAAVQAFLDAGSRDFVSQNALGVQTQITYVWETGGVCYARCLRTIDGVEVADHSVICRVEEGQVTHARGTWCFLTEGKAYSAQLTDTVNILFNVKKEIGTDFGGEIPVRILAIEPCYTLSFYGEEGDFCLIPCKRITTDTLGDYIYNAINGKLAAKN